MDSFIFPKAWQGSAIVTAEIKELLKGETVFSWTYLCPPQFLERGERTGKFRLGTDQIVVAEDSFGRSHISVEDYAVAMIDELEQPKHTGRRFTVGY
jgi:putative NADH-flavin reductase